MIDRLTIVSLRRALVWVVPLVALFTLAIDRKTSSGGHSAPLFIALAASLTVVAGGYLLWERPPVYMFSAGLVLSVFSGNWQNVGLPGFPFLPDRFLLVGSIGLLLLRERQRLRAFWLSSAHVLLVIAGLYVVASAAGAGTLGGRVATFGLLDQFGLMPFLLFFVVPLIVRTQRERRILLFTLVGLGLYLGVEALFETVHATPLLFPAYIAGGGGNGRLGGPFAASVAEGFALFGCAVAAAVALTQSPPRVIRIIAWVVIPLSLLGCLFTLERGIWIGAAVSVLSLGIVARELRRTLLPLMIAGILLVVGALLFVPGLGARAGTRSQTVLSVWDRQNQDAAALRMIKARPLFGFGWSTFTKVDVPFFRQSASYPMTGYDVDLHDVFLSNAVELGLIGFSLWILAQLFAFGTVLLGRAPPEMRPWRLGLAALIIFSVVVGIFNPLEENFPELLLWTWAGVILGAIWESQPGPRVLITVPGTRLARHARRSRNGLGSGSEPAGSSASRSAGSLPPRPVRTGPRSSPRG